MFKAQFLATVLNVTRTPALAQTGILLSNAEKDALGLGACATVTSALVAANSGYAALSGHKVNFMLIKDVFDRINNNVQLTC